MGDGRELRSSLISLASRVGVEESTHEAELVLPVHQNTGPLEFYVHIVFEHQKVHVYAAIIGTISLSGSLQPCALVRLSWEASSCRAMLV
jgi:hypothetical protein